MSKYSKRTYELVAEVLGRVSPLAEIDTETVEIIREQFCGRFAEDNEHFNENVFDNMVEEVAARLKR